MTGLLKYQTFWPRFWAIILDAIFLGIVGWLFPLIGFLLPNRGVENFAADLAPFVYYILMHGFYGQTLGKMVMKVKLLHVDETRDITLKQALIRDIVPLGFVLLFYTISGLGKVLLHTTLVNESIDVAHSAVLTVLVLLSSMILSSLHLLWALTEIVTMLVNEKSRALHDIMAKTVVIRLKD